MLLKLLHKMDLTKAVENDNFELAGEIKKELDNEKK